MWIRPSIPSRSTKAPKSTMLEILPSTTWPGCEAAEDLLADLLALLLEHGAAREDDVVAAAVELDHFALERLAHELVEVVDAADVDQRGGQEAAHPEVEDQAALDDLDHAAFDRLAGLGGGLDPAPGLLEAGALLGEDQAALGVLLGEDEGVDLLAELDLVGRVDRLADRELVGGDDPLGLVADVDQDLVLVDPHDLAVDDVALVEGDHRRRVVGDDLAVDFEQQAVGALDGRARRAQAASMCRSRTRRRMMADIGQPCSGRAGTLARDAVRATKRGDERTPLDGSHDVLICGASFAGLAVARELAGSGADVLVVDRYEIGERQTSACGIPTEWLRATGPDGGRAPALRLAGHPHPPRRPPATGLPWTFSTFDYRELCELLWARLRRPLRDRQGERPRAPGRTATARSRSRPTAASSPPRSSSTRSAGAACWPAATATSRPTRRSRAGSRSTPAARGEDLEIWIDRRYVPAGYGWSFPAERRAADRRSAPSTPASTSRTRPCCWPRTSARSRIEYQGNWIPHKLRRGDRGRRLLRRRLGRALPAADRRGDPHRALLRDRPRPRAARRRRGPPEPRAGRRALRRVQRLARVEVPLDAARPAAASRGSRRACWRPVIRLLRHASASSTGPSATTCGSRRPTSPSSAGRRNGAGERQATPIAACEPSGTSSRPNRPQDEPDAFAGFRDIGVPSMWMPSTGNREQG